MPTYKRITDLPVTETIDKEDLFIVETATGTQAVKIETFKDTEVTKESIGLGNVDNTSDLNKPISTATQAALNLKANTADLADTYLTKVEATNTYLSQGAASGTYLTRANAQSTYLSKADASSTYLTQTDADNTYATRSALDGKQNTLTAGSNISIIGSTINAVDTQYTAGSNINITNGEISFTGEIPTNTSDLINDSGFLTGITSSQVVTALGYTPYNSSNPNSYITRAGVSTNATGLTYNNTTGILSLTSGYTIPTATTLGGITTNANAITAINGKIPSQASSSNQLADKAFVNSTIQTATANFRGNWDTWVDVPTVASDYPEDYSGNKTPTNNDYMVVSDASGYEGEQELTGTWRFKYTGVWSTQAKAGWLPEYKVNEEPFTQAQQAAINSGITADLVSQIGSGMYEGDNVSLLNNDANYQNATQVQTALSSYVPVSRKVNNKTLSTDIALTYTDVNALPSTTKYGASLSVSGKTIQLKDQTGASLGSPITTQDTTYTGGTDITINNRNEISFTNNTGYITGIDSSDVTTALGYSPYDSANPSGYQTAAQVSSAVSTGVAGKQDIISDLDDIREGAGLGATAVQDLGDLGITATAAELNYVDGVTSNIQTQLSGKQATLVSGTNIKTVNNESLLGSGNIEIQSVWEEGEGEGSIVSAPNASQGGQAIGDYSVAEGFGSDAKGNYSHAEGQMTTTNGACAHAEGQGTTAQGNCSHAEGIDTIAQNQVEHAEGQYNKSHKTSTTFGNAGNTIHSVGIGTGAGSLEEQDRKNAIEIMQNGDVYIKGVGAYDGADYSSADTVQEVIAGKQATISDLSTIRTGAGLGATSIQPNDNISELTNDAGYITGITSSDVTTALGFTPYNATNPSGYQTASQVSSAITTGIAGKQDTITDLEDIREGAGLGATAVQPATLSGYVPTSRTINGQALTSDITIDALPSQSGQSGKYLTTNGTNASWGTLDLSSKQDVSNLVTTITASSTDTQYPSAKCVYDLIGNLETILSEV